MSITLAAGSPPSLSDQVTLFRNLAQYMKSGIPLVAGLAHVREQTSSRLGAALGKMQQALEVRHASLTDAFRDHYPAADPFLLAVVERGEASGTLESSFRQLESNAKGRLERRRQLMGDLAYPVFCFLFFLVAWPVPNLVKDGLDAYLIRAVPPLAILSSLAVSAVLVLPRVRIDDALARRLDLLRLGLPLVGRPIRASIQARFARALALLVKTGTPMDRALELAGDASGSPQLALRLKLATEELRRGKPAPLSELLRPPDDILSPSFLSMLKTGEQTGETDTMLERAADLYEGEAAAALAAALKIAGPALNIIVVVLIGAFVINSYQGYLNMLGSIR